MQLPSLVLVMSITKPQRMMELYTSVWLSSTTLREMSLPLSMLCLDPHQVLNQLIKRSLCTCTLCNTRRSNHFNEHYCYNRRSILELCIIIRIVMHFFIFSVFRGWLFWSACVSDVHGGGATVLLYWDNSRQPPRGDRVLLPRSSHSWWWHHLWHPLCHCLHHRWQ